MKRILSLLLTLAVSVAMFGVAYADALQKPSVVCTIFPAYDFVRQIAGDKVELTMLLPPGSESHSFEPTPQDIIRIQNADLFICTGGESDAWVDRILDSMDGQTALKMLDMVQPVEEEHIEGMQSEHEEDEHDDEAEQPEYDEHVWTSPKNAIQIVQSTKEALSELDPENAGAYQANAAEYQAQLARLDTDFQEVADNAARRLVVFGDRFPFRYLADAYGLDYYAAFPGCSTETEPSAKTVAFLIDKVTQEHVPVVFHVELSNEKMADTISEATGAKKLLLHACHNITKEDFEAGADYLSLMRRNLENLKEALN